MRALGSSSVKDRNGSFDPRKTDETAEKFTISRDNTFDQLSLDEADMNS